jgi:hypothetical protein
MIGSSAAPARNNPYPQCKRPDTPLTPRAGTLPRHARVSSVPTYRWLRTKGDVSGLIPIRSHVETT